MIDRSRKLNWFSPAHKVSRCSRSESIAARSRRFETVQFQVFDKLWPISMALNRFVAFSLCDRIENCVFLSPGSQFHSDCNRFKSQHIILFSIYILSQIAYGGDLACPPLRTRTQCDAIGNKLQTIRVNFELSENIGDSPSLCCRPDPVFSFSFGSLSALLIELVSFQVYEVDRDRQASAHQEERDAECQSASKEK